MFRDGTERLLVFRTGAELFAVRLGDVHEVIDTPPLQPLPDAGSRLLGVATVRGELSPVHDPAPVLQVDAARGAGGVVLLFVRGGKRIGLAVDDVFDAIGVEAHELRPAPGSEAADGVLAGVVRRGSELIGVLDAGALLEAATAVMEGGRT